MSRTRMIGFALIGTILSCGVAGLWQRDALTGWYYAWKLQNAGTESLPSYVRLFETLGTDGTYRLVNMLTSSHETACQNAREVLLRTMKLWAPGDPHHDTVLQQMAQLAPQFSEYGCSECLPVLRALSPSKAQSPQKITVLHGLIAQASMQSPFRARGYQALIDIVLQEEQIDASIEKQCKSLVILGIKDNNDLVRLSAIRLAVLPGLQLHEHLVPLVTGNTIDSSAEVRQLVLLALGEHEKLLSIDQLCPFLTDADKEVCSIAERALRVRGLNQQQIQLAKLMHDKNPMARAELPVLLLSTPEVDAYQWMEKLTHDPAPAVRAATARALGASTDQRMSTLLKEISEQDKDGSVQQIARFYYHQQ